MDRGAPTKRSTWSVRAKSRSRPASSSSSRPRRVRRRRSEAVISFSDSLSSEAASCTATATRSDSSNVRDSTTGPSSQARSSLDLCILEPEDRRFLASSVGRCPSKIADEASEGLLGLNGLEPRRDELREPIFSGTTTAIPIAIMSASPAVLAASISMLMVGNTGTWTWMVWPPGARELCDQRLAGSGPALSLSRAALLLIEGARANPLMSFAPDTSRSKGSIACLICPLISPGARLYGIDGSLFRAVSIGERCQGHCPHSLPPSPRFRKREQEAAELATRASASCTELRHQLLDRSPCRQDSWKW